MDSYDSLMTEIRQRSAKMGVIGLGYVGLPLAVLHAQAGFTVTGIERNPDRAAHVNRGERSTSAREKVRERFSVEARREEFANEIERVFTYGRARNFLERE
ncbi:MAG: hypothetical protein HY672_03035 [Chloroflexi bacterium]|nr:hypothetical protein [Chloroflexota bacterium]